MSGDAFDGGLSADQRARIRKLARLYLGRETVPDQETALELLGWQQLDLEVTAAYEQWPAEAKSRVEAAGLPWTHENMLRHSEGVE